MIIRKRKKDMPYGSKESGATMVEASLIILLLTALLIVFVDLFRFFYLHNMVNRAAFTVARNFTKGEIALDLANETCEADPSSCNSMLTFLAESQTSVRTILKGTVTPSHVDSSMRLLKYSHYRQADHNPHHFPHNSVAGATFDIALIRPGEAVYEIKASGEELKIAHPIRPDFVSGRDNAAAYPRAVGAGWPHFTTVTWEDALREYPTIALVGVEFKFLFIPLIDPFVIRASHASYKNSAKQSHMVRSTGEEVVPTSSPYRGATSPAGVEAPAEPGAPAGACDTNSCAIDTCFCSNNPRSDFCRYCPLDACALDCG